MYTCKDFIHKDVHVHTLQHKFFLHTIRSVHRVVLKESFIHKCELCTNLKMCMCNTTLQMLYTVQCTLDTVQCCTLYSGHASMVFLRSWFILSKIFVPTSPIRTKIRSSMQGTYYSNPNYFIDLSLISTKLLLNFCRYAICQKSGNNLISTLNYMTYVE